MMIRIHPDLHIQTVWRSHLVLFKSGVSPCSTTCVMKADACQRILNFMLVIKGFGNQKEGLFFFSDVLGFMDIMDYFEALWKFYGIKCSKQNSPWTE